MLPREAAEREELATRVGHVFRMWGYEPVETPVVESLRVLEAAAGELQGTAFRLFDADGSLLALRPDMTVPIARLTASHLPGEAGPHRLRYNTQVFREHESMQGQARQFTQLGVELIGVGGPLADGEVVAVLVEALGASGLESFTVAIGSVTVLRALVDAGGDESWGARVLDAVHARNLVAVDELAQSSVDPAVGAALGEVVRLRGGEEAIERCREIVAPWGGEAAVEDLSRTWSVLDAAGAASRVVVDFGVLRDFGYYTGLVCEAYAGGLGVPLGGGGRYDGAVGTWGDSAPAAGFALGLERLHMALTEQGAAPAVVTIDALVGGDAEAAFAGARVLRENGWRVAVSAADEADLAEEASRIGAERTLMADADALAVLNAGGETVRRVSARELAAEGPGADGPGAVGVNPEESAVGESGAEEGAS